MANGDLSITIDRSTADALRKRAEDRGVSVPELVAALADADAAPVSVDQEQIHELDRRWANATKADDTKSHRDVVKWLESWGTASYKPWRE